MSLIPPPNALRAISYGRPHYVPAARLAAAESAREVKVAGDSLVSISPRGRELAQGDVDLNSRGNEETLAAPPDIDNGKPLARRALAAYATVSAVESG